MEKKKAHIHFYTNLASFLLAHVESIRLQDELEKNRLIKQLISSSYFYITHNILEEMKKYDSWNDSQIRDICFAFLVNNQINWIIDDDDVKSFYISIVGEPDETTSLKALIENKYNILNQEKNDAETAGFVETDSN